MDNTKDFDSERAAEDLSEFYIPGEWTILDQCNVSAIAKGRFMNGLYSRDECRHPIVMFTSGHYPPPAAWRNDPRICFKPISINIDVDAVKQMMVKFNINENNIKPEHLLKITTVYGRAANILHHAYHTPLPTEADIKNVIYETSIDVDNNIVEFFLFVWPDLVKNSGEEVEQRSDSEDWVVSLEKVEFMGILLTARKDHWWINSVFNWIVLSDQASKSGGDFFYELNAKTMFYSFPLAATIHSKVVESLKNTSAPKIYKTYKRLYDRVSALLYVRDTCPNISRMLGQLFESKIKWFCRSKEMCLILGIVLDLFYLIRTTYLPIHSQCIFVQPD